MVETVTRCDTCGERIYDGLCDYGCEHHWCDEGCKPDSNIEAEFRTCGECGRPMVQGFTVEGGGWYCCEDCFGDGLMDRDYPGGWRENAHEDDPRWCGGYYDYKHDGEWHDTGIFYTEWY